jgi:hypothetical protein
LTALSRGLLKLFAASEFRRNSFAKATGVVIDVKRTGIVNVRESVRRSFPRLRSIR